MRWIVGKLAYYEKRIYLAGPDVFLPNAERIGKLKKEICARHGFEGAFPLDNELNLDAVPHNKWGVTIHKGNEDLMRICGLTIANMTPFRGPSMDVGTANEMGFMRALGRSVLGYRNETRGYLERVLAFYKKEFDRALKNITYTDPDGMKIENFGLGDNLMVDSAVIRSGFAVIQKHVPHHERFTDLEAFEECVKLAQKLF